MKISALASASMCSPRPSSPVTARTQRLASSLRRPITSWRSATWPGASYRLAACRYWRPQARVSGQRSRGSCANRSLAPQEVRACGF